MRQQGDISELQAFLQLPQHKPLRAQLDEAGELMDGKSEIICKMFVVCLDVLLKAFAAFSNTWMQRDVYLLYVYFHIVYCYFFIIFPVLSHRIAELGALVGHTGQRIDSVEMNNKQLGKTRRFILSCFSTLQFLAAVFLMV